MRGISHPSEAKPAHGQTCMRVEEGGNTLRPRTKAKPAAASTACRERAGGRVEVVADVTLRG
jgi:hypothetical protein